MKKIKIMTPENVEVEYKLADVASRIAAAMLDMMIQAVIIALLFIGILLLNHFSRSFWKDYYGWVIGISLFMYAIITYGYFIAMELSTNGQTLGKKVFHLRTIRNNGQPLTFKHSALRNLFRVFIDNFGVGVVMIFFSKEKKRLGDVVASTIVVLEENKERPLTLESLTEMKEQFDYYISKEEQEIVREYFQRKNTMEDSSHLREELTLYFTKKFEALGMLEQGQEFIKKL